MAAVQYVARRLGGSLLQRMPAAVAEEGRLLVPSRFMRPHQLSGKVSGEPAPNIQAKEDDIWKEFKETLKKLEERDKNKRRPMSFSTCA